MEFIGKNGIPAKRLKNAELSLTENAKAYLEIVRMMRKMF